MAAKGGIIGNMVDDNGLAAISDLIADGRCHLKLTPWLQPETDIVSNSAGNPAVFRDPRDSRKAHARGPAHHIQNGRNSVDVADRRDFGIQMIDSDVHRVLALRPA
jgi:hypothetical protein